MASAPVWLTFALLSALFAGRAGVDPDLAMLVRILVIAAILAPMVVLTGKWTNPADLPARPLAYHVLSAVATGASRLCDFRALQLGTVAQVATIDKLSLAFAVVLALVSLGERPGGREWLGTGLVVLGALVMVWKR